ncbi:MAG: PAS domain-containing sensor histidine kinase [Candidatus Krumholzibacteriia bacterium]
MAYRSRSDEHRLTLRLLVRTVLTISSMFLLAMVVAAFLSHRRHHQDVAALAEEKAHSIGDGVVAIMEDADENKLERARAFMTLVARDRLWVNLRVISNGGEVIFSKASDEIGKPIDPKADGSCARCHAADHLPARRKQVYREEGGERVMHHVYPIETRPTCLKCHEPAPLRATIVSDISLAAADELMGLRDTWMYVSVAGLLVLFILGAGLLLRNVAYRPLELVARRLRLVAGGDFSQVPAPAQTDIIGFINHQINVTAARLKEFYDGLETKVAERTQSLRESQEALVGERDKLKFIFDSSTQGFVSVAGDGTILFANQRAGDMLDTPADRLVGRNVSDFTILRQVCDTDRIRSTRVSDTDTAQEHRLYRNENGKHLELQASEIATPGGERATLVMIEDVTEEKEIEKHLDRQERLASMGRLAAGVAHEVGNPLSAISSLIQITEKTGDALEVQENCRLIQKHIGRITTIVRNLSARTRVAEEEHALARIGDIVRGAVEIARWDKRAGRIEFDLGERGGAGDARLPRDPFVQAFLNLILNAMDAVSDAAQPVIRIEIGRRGSNTEIRISDNGKGISEDDLAHIFEPFYTTKPTGMGTGLGLAVTHGIVEKMGGAIEVETIEGEGTTFVVTVPLGSES